LSLKLPVKGKEKEYLLAWTTTPGQYREMLLWRSIKNLSYWKMENGKGEKIILVDPTLGGDLMLVNKQELTSRLQKDRRIKRKRTGRAGISGSI